MEHIVNGSGEVLEAIVRCVDCEKANLETHGRKDELVCWRFRSHGHVTQPGAFCSAGVARE